jgi:hypothetical protein
MPPKMPIIKIQIIISIGKDMEKLKDLYVSGDMK